MKISIFLVSLTGLSYASAACDKILSTTVETCIKRSQIDVGNCVPSDQACLCKAKLPALDCYNVCANDADMSGQRKIKESEVMTACNAAGISTSAATPTSISTSAAPSDSSTSKSAPPPKAAATSNSNAFYPSVATVVFFYSLNYRFI